MNISQTEELRYSVFHYSSIFYKKKQAQMTINLPNVFDRNCGLELLEMVIQDLKISKFSGHTPRHSTPCKIPISRGP